MPNLSASVLEEEGRWIVRYRIHTTSRRDKALHNKPEIVQRLANWNYLTIAEENAKCLIYDVLDQVLQIRQIEAGQTFLHCSAIEKNGDVYIIAGWGGVGKTSSVMTLISDHGYKFLSDDLGILGEEGTFWRSPKRIQIYPYNLEGSHTLRHGLLRHRPAFDRLHWALRAKRRGPKGVRRRVSAEEFFGKQSVATKGRVRGFIHLERGNYAQSSVEPISWSNAAERTSHILVHELSPIAEIGAAFDGAAISSPFASFAWRDTSDKVLGQALQQVPCHKVTVPEDTKPQDLSALLLDLIQHNNE